MGKIEEIAQKRKIAHKKLLDLDSKTYKAFLEMEKAAFSIPNGNNIILWMDKKSKCQVVGL